MQKLSTKQIILMVVAIIIVLWILGVFRSSNNDSQVMTIQTTVRNPNTTGQIIQPYQQINHNGANRNNNNGNRNQNWNQNGNQKQHNIANDITSATDIPNTPYILYFFYSTRCPHCSNMVVEWNNLVDNLRNYPNISTVAVNTDNENLSSLVFYHQANLIPTILLQTPDRKLQYNGNRTSQDIYNFVLENSQNLHNSQNSQNSQY